MVSRHGVTNDYYNSENFNSNMRYSVTIPMRIKFKNGTHKYDSNGNCVDKDPSQRYLIVCMAWRNQYDPNLPASNGYVTYFYNRYSKLTYKDA